MSPICFSPEALQIEHALIRDIKLLDVIQPPIAEIERREQEVLEQKAELERLTTEQNHKAKLAKPEYEAVKLEANKIEVVADVEAYKIEAINKTLAEPPNYIELKKVEQFGGALPVYVGGENVAMIDLRGKN